MYHTMNSNPAPPCVSIGYVCVPVLAHPAFNTTVSAWYCKKYPLRLLLRRLIMVGIVYDLSVSFGPV